MWENISTCLVDLMNFMSYDKALSCHYWHDVDSLRIPQQLRHQLNQFPLAMPSANYFLCPLSTETSQPGFQNRLSDSNLTLHHKSQMGSCARNILRFFLVKNSLQLKSKCCISLQLLLCDVICIQLSQPDLMRVSEYSVRLASQNGFILFCMMNNSSASTATYGFTSSLSVQALFSCSSRRSFLLRVFQYSDIRK